MVGVVVVVHVELALVLAEGVEQAAALRVRGQRGRLRAQQREPHQRQLHARAQRRVVVQRLHLSSANAVQRDSYTVQCASNQLSNIALGVHL